MASGWQEQDVEPSLSACRDCGWMPPTLLPGSIALAVLTIPPCPAGSDQWKMAEKKLFNKGIAIYKKDFFLVQKLVSWGSVSGASEGRELPA